MKYEDQVRRICGEDWRVVSDQERQGGYAVAILIAYLKGTRPTLQDIANHLGVTADEINVSFIRLLRSGAFHRDEWNSKNNPDLLGNSSESEAHRMWAFVAAVGGGYLGGSGRKYNTKKKVHNGSN